MPLRLQVVSRHRQSLGERSSKEFGHNGGTIGRSLESDWVLPDAQRYLSSRHASIDYRSGSYYVVDTSTNGVYVNDAEQPVGRGNPQRLFTGDRVRIGEYEMTVEITGEDDTTSHLTDGNHVDPVSKAQRVPPPDPTRADLLPPHEITAVGIEMMISEEVEESLQLRKLPLAELTLEEDDAPIRAAPPPPTLRRAEPPPVSAAARVTATVKPTPRPAAPAPAAPPAAPAPAAAPPPRARPPTSATPSPPSSGIDAFFRGAGLPAQKVDERQAEQVLHRLGQVMREVVLGLSENLHVRSDHKTALRVPTTTIQPQNNNPLKFSASVEEALTNLLFRDSSEYLSAVDAVRETFTDIKQHQQLLLSAVRTAVIDYVGRLDPDELESKFSSSGKRGGLINAANKLKYWDLYKDLYQIVTQHQPSQFPQQFIEELSRAYEQEASRTTPASAGRSPGAKIG